MSSIPTTSYAGLQQLMKDGDIGGFIIMGANMPGSKSQLHELVAQLTIDPALPPLIAIDEEGGDVTHIPWDNFEGAPELRSAPVQRTTNAFSGRAGLLKESGINTNFGIVADYTSNPSSFIYWRTLGNTSAASADRVAAAVRSESGTVFSTLKHFPGHGVAEADSHFAVPSTDMSLETWRKGPAKPFAAGIDAGAEVLMFGHLAYTSVTTTPASLAPEWYSIARDELGFTGVTITDDLSMLRESGIAAYNDRAATAVAALNAGADMTLFVAGMDYDKVVQIVDKIAAVAESGSLPMERLLEAATRVTELRLLAAER